MYHIPAQVFISRYLQQMVANAKLTIATSFVNTSTSAVHAVHLIVLCFIVATRQGLELRCHVN